MATLRWANGAGGAWGIGANWIGGGVPGLGDSATIDLAGTYTVALNGTESLQSLLLNDAGATIVDTGTLTLGGALTVAAGQFALEAGGVVAGGTLSASGGSFAWHGGTLSGATYQGTLDLTAAGDSLVIANGFTATGAGGIGPGAINATGGASALTFTGIQAIDNLRIDAGNAAGGGTSVNFDTLTLGASTVINQVGGNLNASCWSIDMGTLVVNNGVWQALQWNGGADIVASITNNGLIAAANGGGFTLQGTDIINTGTISASLGSGIGISGYATMVNSGLILDAGGVAIASPSFVNNGRVEISGVNDYFAIIGTYGVPLTDVTTGTGTIDLSGTNVGLRLQQDQSFSGGTVILGGTGNNITISHPYPLAYAATVALGAAAVIDITGTGGLIADDGYAGDRLINNGTITASAAGANATVALQHFENNGLVAIANGDRLAIGNAVSGTGSITLAGGGTAEITGSVATGQSLAFLDGAADLLKLDAAAAMHGTITGFSAGNTIDLAGLTATSAAWNGGMLSLGLAGGGSLALAMDGSYASGQFKLTPDGAGGTNITLTAGTTGGSGTPARIYGGSGATLNAIEGTAVTAAVATFTDSDTTDTAGNFTATITWGDGTSSPGVVSGANGSFTVTPAAGHVFTDEGSFATAVDVLSAVDGVTTTLSGAITSTEADVLTVLSSPAISATAGKSFSATLATFADSYAGATAADLTASITWGDGTTSAGTVSATSGGFAVSGSHNWAAAGTDAVSVTLSDIDGTASATAAITATVAAQAVNQGWTLTKGVDTIDGGKGQDSILARAQTLSPGDHIDGGKGQANSLTLVGGGAFNLTLPTLLDNISTITAVEGIGVATPSITLRPGLDANVTLTSSPSGAGASALVVGAANRATITLGNGSDTVYLGAGETLITGSGNNTIHVDAASAGDRITAGSGNNTLVVDGGGKVSLGRSISGITTVTLSAATNLKLNGMSFVTAQGSAGTDTITAGGANQTLTGGLGADSLVGNAAGLDTFRDTAAGLAGDTIRGFVATDLIDVTDIAFAGAHLMVAAAGVNTRVTLAGGGTSSSFLLQGAFSAAGFGIASDGHAGTYITHS